MSSKIYDLKNSILQTNIMDGYRINYDKSKHNKF